MSFRWVVWLVWQICAELWHSDTDYSIVSRGQWLYHTVEEVSPVTNTTTVEATWLLHYSFINVFSGGWKLFTRRPLTRNKKLPSNHKRPSGCKHICYPHEQDDERNCFSIHFSEQNCFVPFKQTCFERNITFFLFLINCSDKCVEHRCILSQSKPEGT